jgi:hypothetical protein
MMIVCDDDGDDDGDDDDLLDIKARSAQHCGRLNAPKRLATAL